MVATPDHIHAVVTMMALKMGKHVHCQKPLTHSVYEARMIGKAAKEAKVATQMGNHGQASEEARLICETIWSGAIGTVREVHARLEPHPHDLAARHSPAPRTRRPCPPTSTGTCGSARRPMRPYHPCYHPFSWRGWWDFGTGCLGDIGCHQFSAVFKALKLGHPDVGRGLLVEPSAAGRRSPRRPPRWPRSPAGTSRPKATGPRSTLTWWDGGLKPPRPEELEPGRDFAEGDWLMIVGDKGEDATATGSSPRPRPRRSASRREMLERSPGHYKEWFDACKGGPPAGSNFVDHAAHLAEVVLLGNIAIRTKEKLLWDGENLRFTNSRGGQPLDQSAVPGRAGACSGGVRLAVDHPLGTLDTVNDEGLQVAAFQLGEQCVQRVRDGGHLAILGRNPLS